MADSTRLEIKSKCLVSGQNVETRKDWPGSPLFQQDAENGRDGYDTGSTLCSERPAESHEKGLHSATCLRRSMEGHVFLSGERQEKKNNTTYVVLGRLDLLCALTREHGSNGRHPKEETEQGSIGMFNGEKERDNENKEKRRRDEETKRQNKETGTWSTWSTECNRKNSDYKGETREGTTAARLDRDRQWRMQNRVDQPHHC
ncbi:uncharacterized protein SPSK_02745 [Sporothrix schenckii 1099-18]|uniref:Uncharacterized protein n=1 Tax=Sporothrix schenckii 1099-18 TaxID=1397361 RepID=A0A0F2MCL3_SPOSC|nr:uncharacterized protein SPSK_02745 [Sporothrix schenckii 1099-18]KJR86565.1 hypothetical protein SPSK_02745 [Sporothrix schenckii 1099-18]